MTDYDTDTHFDKRLPRLDYNETTIINNKLTTFSHKLECYLLFPQIVVITDDNDCRHN